MRRRANLARLAAVLLASLARLARGAREPPTGLARGPPSSSASRAAEDDYEPPGADESYEEDVHLRDRSTIASSALAPEPALEWGAAARRSTHPAPPTSHPLPPLLRSYPPDVLLRVDDPAYRPGAWLLGRSTYFDAPDAWKRTFDRQIFGDLHGNGCGYVNKHEGLETRDDFPFPIDAVAAVADFDPRFHEAACGSCYEIRCVSGPILEDFDGTMWPYTDPPGFYEVAPDAKDTRGRKIPARNAGFKGADPADPRREFETARCWNESRSIFVTVVDICPCAYSWGVQDVCCGPIPHFDLSYWAHETLAHPIQGKAMLRFRPVRCDTKTPVDARLGAAARLATREARNEDGVLIVGGGSDQRVASFRGSPEGGEDSKTGRREIVAFRRGPAPGWGLSAYRDRSVALFHRESETTRDESDDGTEAGVVATCFRVSPGGRLLAHCRACEETLKPFAGFRAARASIRVSREAGVDDDVDGPPPVYLGVARRFPFDYARNETRAEEACGRKVNVFGGYATKAKRGDFAVVRVPASALGCDGRRAAASNAIFFELGRASPRDREICVDEVVVEG